MRERSFSMKRAFLLFVCVGLLLASPLVYAAEVKIAYINVNRILNESKRGAKEGEAFKNKANELKKVVDKKQKELQTLKESIEKKAAMFSEQARREKEREYQQKVKELERLAQDSNAELRQMEKEMLDKLMVSLQVVVEKLGKEGNYTVILEEAGSSILYATTELDITEQVLKAFDAAKE